MCSWGCQFTPGVSKVHGHKNGEEIGLILLGEVWIYREIDQVTYNPVDKLNEAHTRECKHNIYKLN